MSDNLVSRDATGALVTLRSTEVSSVHTPHQVVRTTNRRFRDGFESGTLDANKWTSSVGSGGSIAVTGGSLVLGSGTTANAETYVLSTATFNTPVRFAISLALSQRIVNQSFLVELVSVNATTGVPDETNIAAWVFDATTATQAKYRVKAQNGTALDSAASTVLTTAGGVSVYEIEPSAIETWFHCVGVDSTASRSNSYRRHQKAMDPDCVFKVRLRWLNGATAPASNTTATVGFVVCQDNTELTAELSNTRGQVSPGMALPVFFSATQNVNAACQDNTWFQESIAAQALNAVVTGTARDTAAATGSAHRYTKFNAFAHSNVGGSMRIEVSVDNTTWRRATVDAPVAADTPVIISIPVVARYARVVYTNGGTAQTTFLLTSSYTVS